MKENYTTKYFGEKSTEFFFPPQQVTMERTSTSSRDDLKVMARDTRRKIEQQLPTPIGGEALILLQMVAGAIRTIAMEVDTLRLPETSQERTAFAHMLVDSQIHFKGNFHVIAPVCPDYSSGENFYRDMRGGVSPEAKAAIRAAYALSKKMPLKGFTPRVDILVADTEDDMPEIIQNCAGGDLKSYQEYCLRSTIAVKDEVKKISNVSVMTFKEGLGNKFRDVQYSYENIITDLMKKDQSFLNRVEKIGKDRVDRHSQILNRKEKKYELTIRYMAQYAALGTLIRQRKEPIIILNYDTPNRAFFNSIANRHPQLCISKEDERIIPILGSVRGR